MTVLQRDPYKMFLIFLGIWNCNWICHSSANSFVVKKRRVSTFLPTSGLIKTGHHSLKEGKYHYTEALNKINEKYNIINKFTIILIDILYQLKIFCNV